MKENILKATNLALDGKWEEAHQIVADLEDDPYACWLHAVLHKIEGDIFNSKYWYRMAKRQFTNNDSETELQEIRKELL